MKFTDNKYLKLAIWLTIILAASSILGMLTRYNIAIWYQNINRSSLTPPNYLFPIVWTILYILIAFSGWIIWNYKFQNHEKTIKLLFVAQLILNWIWTPIFFHYHLLGLALLVLIFMNIILFMTILLCLKRIKIVSILMIPYQIWIIFACYLNFYIWTHN